MDAVRITAGFQVRKLHSRPGMTACVAKQTRLFASPNPDPRLPGRAHFAREPGIPQLSAAPAFAPIRDSGFAPSGRPKADPTVRPGMMGRVADARAPEDVLGARQGDGIAWRRRGLTHPEARR